LDLQNIAMFTDYFVICTGTSDRMLDALADAVIEKSVMSPASKDARRTVCQRLGGDRFWLSHRPLLCT